jgi:hypothetical protein
MALPRRDDLPFCFLFLSRGHLEANPSTKRSSTGVELFFLDTWTFFDSWDIPPNIIPLLPGHQMGWMRFFPFYRHLFARNVYYRRFGSATHFGISFVFSLTGNEVTGVVSRHTTAPMLCRGMERKGGHTFFGLSCRCGISQAWAGIWRVHSLFECALMMNARKETNDGRGPIAFSFLFTFFFFFY